MRSGFSNFPIGFSASVPTSPDFVFSLPPFAYPDFTFFASISAELVDLLSQWVVLLILRPASECYLPFLCPRAEVVRCPDAPVRATNRRYPLKHTRWQWTLCVCFVYANALCSFIGNWGEFGTFTITLFLPLRFRMRCVRPSTYLPTKRHRLRSYGT